MERSGYLPLGLSLLSTMRMSEKSVGMAVAMDGVVILLIWDRTEVSRRRFEAKPTGVGGANPLQIGQLWQRQEDLSSQQHKPRRRPEVLHSRGTPRSRSTGEFDWQQWRKAEILGDTADRDPTIST